MAQSARKPISDDDLYPASDDMGEHEIQRLIAELLRPLLARFLAEQRRLAHVGADQFIYWEQGKPFSRLAPDVYVLPGVDPDIAIRSWKTWETGVVPSFALEVVGDDVAKDYEHGPALYDRLGVQELVVFDPHAVATSRRRIRFQLFRRVGKRGLVRVEASQGDRVFAKTLGGFVRAVGTGDAVRLRVGLGENGDELFPTEAEAERAEKEAERVARLSADAARLSAEREVERLRALLEAAKRRR
jgi:Uma2 family endonuclease